MLPEVPLRHYLPALMGSLHQQHAEGELVLEQNDGVRRLYWSGGDLRHLRSDAVGEQFGNFLIRRGVLDMASLKDLLADGEGATVGERVVQLGLMSREERDGWLHELLGSVLLHAMEHLIIRMTWNPGPLEKALGGDLQFHLNHRRLVWETFQNAKIERELADMFLGEPDWTWKAPSNLLESLSDLPLTPTLAYALSLLGHEPLGCQTIVALTGLPQGEAFRLVATLWTLGGLNLVRGNLLLLPKVDTPQAPKPEPEPIMLATEDLTQTHDEPLPTDAVHLHGEAPMGQEFQQIPVEPLDEEEPSPFERARYLMVKAKSYLVQERISEAIRALEQSIQLDSDSPQAYQVWLLLGRLRTGNPAWSTRAIEALQTASRLNPAAAEPWVLMGELYHKKGFHANAEGCFRRALERDPSVAVPSGFSLEKPLEEQLSETPHGRFAGKLRSLLIPNRFHR